MQLGAYDLDDSRRKEGGQAFVYFGTDRFSGQRVAVKLARPSDWSRRRIRREIEVQSKLEHPNILPIIGTDPQKKWYAMREAQESLDDLGSFQRSSWTRLRVGLFGVAEGIRYAHAQGYVHRDLSPGNVLIFPDRWVVADWGFVYMEPKTSPRMTQPLEHFGTPEFMAPELVADPRKASPPADVYAIGRLAVWGTGLDATADYRPDDSFIRWWQTLIRNTVSYDPSLRWTMDDVVVHLRGTPTLVATNASEPCPACHSERGLDSSGHCLTCHSLSPY
jgi:serine/threonine protein kinase